MRLAFKTTILLFIKGWYKQDGLEPQKKLNPDLYFEPGTTKLRGYISTNEIEISNDERGYPNERYEMKYHCFNTSAILPIGHFSHVEIKQVIQFLFLGLFSARSTRFAS